MMSKYIIKGFALFDNQELMVQEIIDLQDPVAVQKAFQETNLKHSKSEYLWQQKNDLLILTSPLDENKQDASSPYGVLVVDKVLPLDRAVALLELLINAIREEPIFAGNQKKKSLLEFQIQRIMQKWNSASKIYIEAKQERMKEFNKPLGIVGLIALLLAAYNGYLVLQT